MFVRGLRRVFRHYHSASSTRVRGPARWLGLLLALAIGEASGAQLQLSWIYDELGGEGGFRIERKADTEGDYQALAVQVAGVTSYTDSTVADRTTYCYRVQAYDATGSSPYSNEACGSAAAETDLALTVSVAGTGQGTVASTPDGITCGTDCVGVYSGGTIVTLSATPAVGSTFQGWSGGGCAGTDPCTLTGNAPVTVTAAFAPVPPASQPVPPTSQPLTVTEAGPGKVTSSPSGIDCNPDCSASYASGTVVTLTAMPNNGARFLGWSGACSGTGSCVVALDAPTAVSARFTKGRGHAASLRTTR